MTAGHVAPLVLAAVVGLAPVVRAAAAEQKAPARPVAAPAHSPGRAGLDVVPLHYQLTLTPDIEGGTFEGDLAIDLRVDKVTTRFALDAVDLDVADAEILLPYGRQATPAVAADAAAGTVTFTSDTRLHPGPIKLRLRYRGRLRSDGRGLYLVRSHGRKYVLSQMEATDARRAFPCVDDPAYKASFALAVVVDGGVTAVSNGRLVSDTPAPDGVKRVLRFGTTPRMSTYLVALAIGQFDCTDAGPEAIPLRVCAAPELEDRRAFVLEAARQAFRFHAQYFTFKYPFGKLDLVAVPGRFPGAMENSAAIYIAEEMLVEPGRVDEAYLADVAVAISHEVAHQWLGDVVTMRWWDDLWLNEGLATWLAPKAVAAWKPEWRVDLARAAGREAMALDALRSARAVRAPVASEAEIEESFDAIAYDKAAAILRMVEAWVGPDAVRNGINAFVRQHAYANATAEDLWAAVTASAGEPVDQVMRAFVTQPGIPLVTIESVCEADETVVTASVRRLDPATPRAPVPVAAPAAEGRKLTPPSSPWPIPLQLRGVNPASPMLVSTSKLLTAQAETFRIGGCFPAVLANSGATGYFHTAHQPAALAHLTSLAAARMMPAEKIRLLDDQWALAAAGLSGIGDYLTVVAALAADPAPEVLASTAPRLAFLRERIASDAARGPFERWVRDTIGPAAATFGAAGPSSGGDAALVVSGLEEALKDAGQREALPSRIAAGLEDSVAGPRVWRFLTSRWTELEPMMGTAFALSDIVDAAGSFCDADMRNEVERFFSDKAATARRTLRLSLDRIDACRDFRLRQEARLGEWLGKM